MEIRLWKETGTKWRSSKISQPRHDRRTIQELHLGWVLRTRQKRMFCFLFVKRFTWIEKSKQIAIGILSKGKLLSIKSNHRKKVWGCCANIIFLQVRWTQTPDSKCAHLQDLCLNAEGVGQRPRKKMHAQRFGSHHTAYFSLKSRSHQCDEFVC